MSKRDSISVIVLFYAGWFASVLLALTDASLYAIAFPVLLLLFLFSRKLLEQQKILLAGLITIVGLLFDFLLISFEMIEVRGLSFLAMPVWLISIWLLFSLSIVNLAQSLKTPLWLASVLGLVFGPLSYKSGEVFQVLRFTGSSTFYLYAFFWALIFPAILFGVRRWT